jgi:thioredoxin-like negative regulator of GroEL
MFRLFFVCAFASFAMAGPVRADASTEPAPGHWYHGPVDDVLARIAPHGVIVAEVGADWCPPCNQLALEVLDGPHRASLLGGDFGLRVDFESPSGQAFARRFGVINLPTTVVIAADGKEIGRVEGYVDARDYLDGIADARAGRLGLKALEARVHGARPTPEDRLALAKARLFAGQVTRGTRELDRLIADRAIPVNVASQAARTRGRWLARVVQDHEAARQFFDRMVKRFAKSERDVAHFRYWAAQSLAAAGRTSEAQERFLEWQRAEPESSTPWELAAGFFVHHAYPVDVCQGALDELVARVGWNAERHYLAARIALRREDRLEARAAIERALAEAPDEALYRNFLAALGAP